MIDLVTREHEFILILQMSGMRERECVCVCKVFDPVKSC